MHMYFAAFQTNTATGKIFFGGLLRLYGTLALQSFYNASEELFVTLVERTEFFAHFFDEHFGGHNVFGKSIRLRRQLF